VQHQETIVPELIHPTAIVSARATLGRGNVIGPYAVVEDDVVIGDDNRIGAHSVIKDGARIGNANRIHEHVVFAGPPQDIGFQDTPTTAELGNGNVLREFVTVSRATAKEVGRTTIGDNNYFMACTHVAHDCRLGNHIIMANDAVLAGHVHIEDRVFVSGGVKIHQFAQIGEYAMIGGNSKITQDCLPYMITDGIPGRVCGLNLVGLRRAGFSAAEMSNLKAAYQILFGARGSLEQQLAELGKLGTPTAQHLLAFIRASKRSFHRA
jgi:UDP-N-acetylglucosamine acyltransferase